MYCDFAIALRREIPSARFVESIAAEMVLRSTVEDWVSVPIETIYLGGGTPSRLEADAIRRLLDCIRAGAPSVAAGAELTIEANPEDVSPESARAWVEGGINRVSLGAQSFHPDVLDWMHRVHSADDTRRAVDILRDAGITNLSIDLIFGLPSDLRHAFARDLATVVELEPDHLSVYGLTIEPRTPLFKRQQRGTTVAAPNPSYEAEFLQADSDLGAAGFEHYEVSNYARSMKRAVHNSAYWQGRAYVGLGPSAHSFRENRRRWNEREWTQYDKVVGEGRDPVVGTEDLTAQQVELEALMVGLRTVEGVALPLATTGNVLDELVDCGWLTVGGGRARLTPTGWLRLESILTRLTTQAESG